ncbi:Serine/threonine-protein phosphatase 1 [Bremerella volcania]|uniref:Serine/threonine-protein phosphatase 1 n=1 Tax=Bremerella volcania TaxID=2527984 RepID=A0A518CG54_9BACT|nr:metallophosphoesterase family protein [Bremerella volcania]QDU78205.1 Serine/threonine-protein phosphatase 1 [Bremerella volcania]
MRTLAIGDVHGCLIALKCLLDEVGLRPDDRIVFLGDYVDRGPNSRGVIQYILELRDQYDVVCLRGNHEIMMLTARDDSRTFNSWLGYGGEETLESYAPDTGEQSDLEHVSEQHWLFLESVCQPYFEDDSHIFVHGNVRPDLPLNEQDNATLYWDKFINRGPHFSGKKVICGHTSQKSGWPLDVGHSVVIDTWACGTGWLTCLDTESGHFWQANQVCDTRSGTLA